MEEITREGKEGEGRTHQWGKIHKGSDFAVDDNTTSLHYTGRGGVRVGYVC